MAIRAFALLVLFSCSPPALHAQPPPESVTPELGADTVPTTVTQVATLIDREYMDHAVAARLSDHLRRRLADGAYVRAATPEALTTQLTRDHGRHAPAQARGRRDHRHATKHRRISDTVAFLLGYLTAARTFSAGEGFAFLLQERQRAEVIGERTAGAANPGRPYPVGALFEVTIPNGKLRSAIGGGNWEGRGVTPDVEVVASDAQRIAHARALERLGRPGPP